MALILLADDDPLMGDLVRALLGARGHVVGVVTNGRDALRAIELKRPSLVILDCSMPELPGVETLRRIRLSPVVHRTPVLMLTARRSDTDVEIAMRAGANEYLKKPFDPDELVAVAEHLLARSPAAVRRAVG